MDFKDYHDTGRIKNRGICLQKRIDDVRMFCHMSQCYRV